MSERNRRPVAAPPDDGHSGSTTLPDETMSYEEPDGRRKPELMRDLYKTKQDRTDPPSVVIFIIALVVIIGGALLLVPWC